jgi:probable O-glycosylation ligase (exosortase A-associated)
VPLRGALLLTVFLICLPVCFFRPFFGIILWTIVAFMNPQSYMWSSLFSFPWAMAVAIPTLAGVVPFCRGWIDRVMCREVLLMILLWGWFTITTLVSTHTSLFAHHAEETLFRWGFVSKILLMTIVTIGVVDSFERLSMIIRVIAGCFGFFVLKALPFMLLTGGVFRLYGPENSMIGDNNDFGLALNMTLPLFFGLAQTEPRAWQRRLFGFLFLVTIPAIFFTYSRGALVGLTVLSVLMFLQLKQRLVLIPVIVLALIIALLLTPEAWQERMDPTREDAIDASAHSRLNAWTFSWRMALDSPIVGGGFDTFTPELFTRYAPNPADVHGPHSVYFGVLAEHGFAGLALYLMLALSCFITIRRVVKEARRNGDQRVVHYANMCRFSLVGFFVSGLFLGRAYFDYYFTIVACVVILKQTCQSEWMEMYPAMTLEEEQVA